MTLTGSNLERARRAIELALDELHNQIATCPDVGQYFDEIEALEAEQRQMGRLLALMERALERERRKG